MTQNRKNRSLFTRKELEYLPLTYRNMELQSTSQVDELNIDACFSESEQHFSEQYMVFVSHKPISNFLLLFDDEKR